MVKANRLGGYLVIESINRMENDRKTLLADNSSLMSVDKGFPKKLLVTSLVYGLYFHFQKIVIAIYQRRIFCLSTQPYHSYQHDN